MGSAETGEAPVFDASIPLCLARCKPSTQAAPLCQWHWRSTAALNVSLPAVVAKGNA